MRTDEINSLEPPSGGFLLFWATL